MFKIKTLVAVLIIFISSVNYAQHTDEINSNRPGETMSAFSVGKSVIQLETGAYGIRQKHELLNYDSSGYGIDLTARWGLFLEKLELIADIQYQSEILNPSIIYPDKSGLRQTVFGAKYLIYDPFKNYKKKVNLYSWKANQSFNWHQLVPAVSVFAGANLIFSDNPYAFSPEASISPKIILITQNHLGDGRWVFVTNIIADYISTDFPSYGYVATLTRGFNKKWSGFFENQGFKSDFYSDAIVRGGAAYLISKDIQIDASIGSSLKNTPSILYGGVGFSWRYDANYKEVKISTDSEYSSNKVKRRAKKTKKG
jgi:Putative MetA-pathway of phenol degradation